MKEDADVGGEKREVSCALKSNERVRIVTDDEQLKDTGAAALPAQVAAAPACKVRADMSDDSEALPEVLTETDRAMTLYALCTHSRNKIMKQELIHAKLHDKLVDLGDELIEENPQLDADMAEEMALKKMKDIRADVGGEKREVSCALKSNVRVRIVADDEQLKDTGAAALPAQVAAAPACKVRADISDDSEAFREVS